MPEPLATATSTARALIALSRIRPWKTTKLTDKLVSREWEDLDRWVRDQLQKEASELETSRERRAARGMIDSGDTAADENRIRDQFAREWRDRKSEFDRRLEDVLEAEGIGERGWRWLTRRALPADDRAERIRSISQDWQRWIEDERV